MNRNSRKYFTLDYHPFGMVIEERSKSGTTYRFGFNGVEAIDQMNALSNVLDFGARIFSSSISTWFSQDPLAGKYPSNSPYSFATNNPIIYSDHFGEERRIEVTYKTDKGSFTFIKVLNKHEVEFKIVETYNSVRVESYDIVTSLTVDLSAQGEGEYSRSHFKSIRNTGIAAWKDLCNDRSSGIRNAADGELPFGFQYVGGEVNSTWTTQTGADVVELLDISSLMYSSGLFNPKTTGLSGKLDEYLKSEPLTRDQQALKDAVKIFREGFEKSEDIIERTAEMKKASDAPRNTYPQGKRSAYHRAVTTYEVEKDSSYTTFERVKEGSGKKDTLIIKGGGSLK